MITIYLKNLNKDVDIEKGTSALEVYEQLKNELSINPLCAKVNNKITSLSFRIYSPKEVEFVDYSNASARRTYARTLFFILAKAVNDLYPNGGMTVYNPLSNGYFCAIKKDKAKTENCALTDEEVACVKQRMQEIIDADIKIQRHECRTEDAIEKFESLGLISKARLLRSLGRLYTQVYEIDGYSDYFYGALLPTTSWISLFDIMKYDDGILLRVPSVNNPKELAKFVPQEKMHQAFQERHKWQNSLGLNSVGELNEAVEKGHATDLINISEAIQEKSISKIAEQIVDRKDVKIVLIAGPSSSGKTSTCKRLSIQLITCGKMPLQISLDDYFVNRDQTPKQPNGDYDYESIYALNLDLFNKQLTELLEGKEVRLPRYNFITGMSEESNNVLKMNDNNVLVIEGIHALNPMLTSKIDDKFIFRLYASALTTITLDEHNYIPTTDNRLLRRIVRDAKTRGCDARETIRRWPSVREGENKWIFPYQENADAMFNTAMFFELTVLKSQAEPMLERVPENCEEYSEAYRLRKFLKYISYMPDNNIPPTSLIREFLGGSSFEY